MGAVPAARRAGRAVSVGSARRRQGRAARRARAAELGRAALGRYPRAEGLIMARLMLPTSSRRLEPCRTGAPSPFPAVAAGPFNRRAFAAVHVVADPLSDKDPWVEPAIDWAATIAYRQHLWRLGFAVAEAMDTAQRGMGLDWPTSLELIGRSVAAAAAVPGAIVFGGAGTDHLPPGPHVGIDDVIGAYEEQCAAIEKLGGRIVLMASRALAAAARTPDDYAKVYARVLSQLRQPVIIHWLGDMFDPALAGYWGHEDLKSAMDVCLAVLADNAEKIDGVKISLLSGEHEIAMRRRLPRGKRMYTGDDFHFAELIATSTAIPTPCSASSTPARPRRPPGLRAAPRSDRAVVAAHFRGADAVLPDRRGVHGVAQRTPGPFRDGRRPAQRASHPALVRIVPARRPGGAAARSGSRRPPHAHAAGDQRHRSVMGPDPSLLSLNTATVRAQGKLDAIIAGCERHGIRGIAPWRDQIAELGLRETQRRIRDAGLTVTGLCRGGFFTARGRPGLAAAIEENRRAVEEAAELSAQCLVLVVGGLPDGSRDIADARALVEEGIAAILQDARDAAVPLAIEPLRPMYAADRACINTLAQANALCERLGEGVGIAVDVYHVWWDPGLARSIAATPARRLLGFHICDWLSPT